MKRTTAQYMQAVKEVNPTIKPLGKYVYAHQHVEHLCLTCKHKWDVVPTSVLRGVGCPKCARAGGAHNRKTHADYVRELKAVTAEIKVVGKYAGADAPIEHKHKTCGHVWEARPLNTLRGRGCPKCKLRMRQVTLGKRSVLVRGYEDKALTWILKNTELKSKDINVHNEKTVPNFGYTFRGTKRRYFPDFFIPKRKMIVEVKSVSTLGLYGNCYAKSRSELFYMTVAKGNAVKAEGYKFVMMLMSEDGTRIALPNGWMRMTRKDLALRLGCEL